MGEVISLIKDGKGLKASIEGATYRSAKERAEPKNFKKSKPYYIDFIERLILFDIARIKNNRIIDNG